MTYLTPTEIDQAERILFTDFEATALDFDEHCVPLEIAAIVTDGLLNDVATFGPYTIKATPEDLGRMSDYVTAMHTKTGLIGRVLSDDALPLDVVERLFTAFIAEHFPAKGKVIPAGSVLHTNRTVTEDEKFAGAILGGSTIKYDWNVIRRHLPAAFALVDYRVIDTSSFREVIRRVDPRVYDRSPKVVAPHEAMADIRISIDELRWFCRNALFGGTVVADFAGAGMELAVA